MIVTDLSNSFNPCPKRTSQFGRKENNKKTNKKKCKSKTREAEQMN